MVKCRGGRAVGVAGAGGVAPAPARLALGRTMAIALLRLLGLAPTSASNSAVAAASTTCAPPFASDVGVEVDVAAAAGGAEVAAARPAKAGGSLPHISLIPCPTVSLRLTHPGSIQRVSLCSAGAASSTLRGMLQVRAAASMMRSWAVRMHLYPLPFSGSAASQWPAYFAASSVHRLAVNCALIG